MELLASQAIQNQWNEKQEELDIEWNEKREEMEVEWNEKCEAMEIEYKEALENQASIQMSMIAHETENIRQAFKTCVSAPTHIHC
jgi:hypothetical protein